MHLFKYIFQTVTYKIYVYLISDDFYSNSNINKRTYFSTKLHWYKYLLIKLLRSEPM